MQQAPSIFKAYDIRGIYPDELNEDTAYKVGRAFSALFRPRNAVVARDMRASSGPLFAALVKGLTEGSVNVIDAGLAATPMLYFAVAKLGYDSGISVTASHNPGMFNGFKLVARGSLPIGGEKGIYRIGRMVEKGAFPPSKKKKGKVTRKDFTSLYVRKMLSFAKIRKLRHFRIAADAGNGMGGVTGAPIFRKLNCEVFPLYFEPDGSFPNHEANPLKEETLKDLKEAVFRKKADFGVAFDGDADRMGLVDENGEFVPADLLAALLAGHILRKRPGRAVVYTTNCSRVVREEIEAAGGVPVMCPVGHVFVKEAMRRHRAVFAGEISGHFYYEENYYNEAPFGAMLQLMEMLTQSGKPLSALIRPLRRYVSTGEMNFEVADKQGKLAAAEKAFRESKRIFQLDGLSVEDDDFWFNLRPSNTENLLRLKIEAKRSRIMEDVKKRLVDIIEGKQP